MKYGTTQEELSLANKQFGFENSPVVRQIREKQAIVAQELEIKAAKADGMGLTEENKKFLTDEVEKIRGERGGRQIEIDEQTGLIKFEDYMKLEDVFCRLVNRSIVKRKNDFMKERFALFKESNKQEYGRVVVKGTEQVEIYKEVILDELCGAFNIHPMSYITSQEAFMNTPG